MKTVAIQGNKRNEINKRTTKAVRKAGEVPCVIHGKEGPVHFSAPSKSFKSLIYTPEFKVAEIDLDGTVLRSIVKEMQFHPITDVVQHIDFIELVPGRVIKTSIPIALIGSAPGVKVGGKLQKTMRRVKIKTTPESLVDHLKVDVSHLELGKSIRVRDIEKVEGIEIMSPPNIPLASVEIPRALKSAQAAEAGETVE